MHVKVDKFPADFGERVASVTHAALGNCIPSGQVAAARGAPHFDLEKQFAIVM
jgi:hypothetical protein